MKVLASIIAAIWLCSCFFVLDQRQLAVVTMFGDPVKTIQAPGLKWKLPWPIQFVHRFDARSQLLEAEVQETFTKDTKTVVLSPFVVWKIQDPELFLERVNSIDLAATPINDIVTSRIGSAIGEVNFADVLHISAEGRALLPATLISEINQRTEQLGIEVQHVRLRKLNLPIQNEQSIYERMRAERSKIAGEYRAIGEEEALKIRAKADSKATGIRTEAEKNAAITIATAEREAARLYAENYQQNPELYRLLRDLESVESMLEDGGTLVLSAEKRPFSTLFGDE